MQKLCLQQGFDHHGMSGCHVRLYYSCIWGYSCGYFEEDSTRIKFVTLVES